MHALFQDVESYMDEHNKGRWNPNHSTNQIENAPFLSVLYADDTACLTLGIPCMQRLLVAIETIGETYGLKLNKKKSVLLIKPMPGKLYFKDGTRVSEVEETNYLGCKLNVETDMTKELQQRINKCRMTLKRLDTFWLKGSSSHRFKLRVYAWKLTRKTAACSLSYSRDDLKNI